MPSVVIIHAADDALPARALGEKLRLANLTPVIEKAPGEERQNAVKNAALAIALWSPRSVADAGVAGDVAFAAGRGQLVHACMQSVQPPGDFRGAEWVDLTGWRGEDEFPAWRQLAALATEKAGVAPLPPPADRPPSGFFQPGRTAPQPQPQPQARAPEPVRAPPPPRPAPAAPPRAAAPPPRPPEPREEKSGPNMALIGIITFVVVALAGGGWFFLTQSQSGAGAGEWAQVDQTDPDEIRAFIENASGGARSQAQAALNQLDQSRYAAAREADTIEALEAYVADFPRSEHTLAARGRIAELRSQPAAPAETPIGEPLAPEALNPGAEVDPDLVPPGVVTAPPATSAPVPLTPAPEPLPEPEPENPPEPGTDE
ncbi:MAG TPA: hypothetical protein PLK37_05020 [Terricaulis sp.]|nr:hypothetical protein [Terricaulis sp.]